MICKNPVIVKFPSNKQGIFKTVIDPYTGERIYGSKVPCGRCIPCKIQKAREWALRCCLELPYWESACFATLTYDDDHLPENGSLVKSDLQKFFKRVRRDLDPFKIKYFACGEYGSNTNRCHYHAIIFGVGCTDNNSSFGNILESNWDKGRIFVGDCTFHSARYCCEYVFKKYNGNKKLEVYDNFGLESPFQLQSLGIGKQYLLDNLDLLYERGYVLYRGSKFSLPRYFADFMQNYDEKRYFDMKKRLISTVVDDNFKNYDDFLFQSGKKSFDKAQLVERKSIFFDRRK